MHTHTRLWQYGALLRTCAPSEKEQDEFKGFVHTHALILLRSWNIRWTFAVTANMLSKCWNDWLWLLKLSINKYEKISDETETTPSHISSLIWSAAKKHEINSGQWTDGTRRTLVSEPAPFTSKTGRKRVGKSNVIYWLRMWGVLCSLVKTSRALTTLKVLFVIRSLY